MAAAPVPTFRSGVVNFTPVATATDILAIAPQFYGRMVQAERFTLTGTATAAAVLDVLIQRSANGGGGTSAAQETAYADGGGGTNTGDYLPTGRLYAYTANRASNGNGVDSTRPIIASGKLYLGKSDGTVVGSTLDVTFTGPKKPSVKDINDWLVVNLRGSAVPAGCSLNITVEWSERAAPPVVFSGDSTTSNAIYLFNLLGATGAFTFAGQVKNRGSNGFRLEDALLNSNGVTYPLVGGLGCIAQTGTASVQAGVMVLSYGINDMRTGAKTRDELISMIDAAIYATLNGTTNGAVYASDKGAQTRFTWTADTTGNPNAKIILWGCNPLTTDGNGSNYVTLTGRFASGYTVAQAAQVITDDLYNAYQAFANDPRIFALVQKQDVLGRRSVAVADSGAWAYNRSVERANSSGATTASGFVRANLPTMTDILHPNEWGQAILARQIAPVVKRAVDAVTLETP